MLARRAPSPDRPGLRKLSLIALVLVGVLLAILAALAPSAQVPPAQATWRTLEPGLELGTLPTPRPTRVGDSMVRVLRIDPEHFQFHLLNASAGAGGTPRTAKGWCEAEGMVAAINASMYQTDHRTSVSLMRTREHTNNSRLSKDMAVLAFDRNDAEAPRVTILDRECDDFESWRGRYGTLVQSIRMLSCRGKNVWSQQERRWSTAAIAVDRGGKVLFVHVRSPFTTHDLIEVLRELPLEITRAMYVEGGPEAQLFVRSGDVAVELVGSFETGFYEADDNASAWPVPNVVAISRRAGAAPSQDGG